MKKSLLLIAALLMVITVNASTYYGIKVGGVAVNSDNCSNVTGSNILSGTVSYDPDTKRLTLTNVVISRTGSDNRAIFNESCANLNVRFVGTCNLASADAAPVKLKEATTFVAEENASVTITGTNEEAIYLDNSDGSSLGLYGATSSSYTVKSTNKAAISAVSGGYHSIRFESGNVSIEGGKGCISSVKNVLFCLFENNPDPAMSITLKGNTAGYAILSGIENCDMIEKGFYPISPSGVTFNTTTKTLERNGSTLTSGTVLIKKATPITAEFFPDAAFRSYPLSRSYGQDGFLTDEEGVSVTSMGLAGKNIHTISGIEYFPNLTMVNVQNNNITDANDFNVMALSCPKLEYLYISNNPTEGEFEFPLPHDDEHNALKYLYANNTNLSKITVWSKALKIIKCNNNPNMTYLAVYGVDELENVEACNSPRMRVAIGLSSNITKSKLTSVDCHGDSIYDLWWLRECPVLKYLDLSDNHIDAFDYPYELPALDTLKIYGNKELYYTTFSYLPAVRYVDCHLNSISSSAQFIAGIPTSTNSPELRVKTLDDSAERCPITAVDALKIIAKGWRPFYQKNGEWIPYEDGIEINSFTFPNNAFREYMYSTSIGKDSVLTYSEIAATKTLLLTSMPSITNLKGIEYFTELENLYCYGDGLTSLDLSANTKLKTLWASNNSLWTLDLSNNTALNEVYIHLNRIRGSYMEQFVENLPTVENGTIRLRYTKNVNKPEQNTVTDAQIAAIIAKGWNPYYNDDTVDDWTRYPNPRQLGDMDDNGLLEVNDVVILAEYAMSGGADAEALEYGDMDGSGTIDVNDVVVLAEMVMGS